MAMSRTQTVTTTRILKYPPSTILPIIQSPSDIIHLNPLVTSDTQSSSDPSAWGITDQLTMMWGVVSWKMQYVAHFEVTSDGMKSRTDAGSGVSTTNIWKCVGTDGSEMQSEVTEIAEVTAPLWLISYVVSTLKKAHDTLMDALERAVEDRALAANNIGS